MHRTGPCSRPGLQAPVAKLLWKRPTRGSCRTPWRLEAMPPAGRGGCCIAAISFHGAGTLLWGSPRGSAVGWEVPARQLRHPDSARPGKEVS